MKNYIAFLTLALFGAMIPSAINAQQSGSPNGLTVHEWGTFTTLTGSDGVLLPGLYHEEEYLPNFVDNFTGFNGTGHSHKGFSFNFDCENVTVKMETPVIYFYSDVARSTTVRVDYPGGAISQWYPSRSDGEVESSSGYYDFASQHNGWITWNANILAKSENDTLGLWKYGETHTWQAPRATDANVVTDNSGNVEKYLFYRGVGNANFMDGGGDGQHYFLKTSFEGNTLVIKNLTHYNILYGFVFERKADPKTGDTVNTVWWSGPINDGAKITCSEPKNPTASTFDATLTTFRDKLVEKGLYKKEADAMIDTWRQSYFGMTGLRVFWIVPTASTAKTLPMTITPQPDALSRVLVARSEVLTPEFEKELVDSYNNGTFYSNYYSDRYYLAYQARIKALASAGVVENTPQSFRLYPNPTAGKFTFSAAQSGTADINLLNLLGENVAHIYTGYISTGDHAFTYDATQVPSGTYICTVRMTGQIEKYPVIIVK